VILAFAFAHDCTIASCKEQGGIRDRHGMHERYESGGG
jgi:hypothetical protein